MIFPSITLGLVATFVWYLLQQRAWRHERKEETRQREFEECMKIIDTLAKAIDKRLYATSRLTRSIDADKAHDEKYQELQTAVKDWMHEFLSFKSKIFHFFGYEKMLEFENEIHASLRTASNIIFRTHRVGFENLNARDKQEHRNIDEALNFARYRAHKFIRELNEMTAAEQTQRLALYDNIDAGKIDLISHTYLIQRLLGMRA